MCAAFPEIYAVKFGNQLYCMPQGVVFLAILEIYTLGGLCYLATDNLVYLEYFINLLYSTPSFL